LRTCGSRFIFTFSWFILGLVLVGLVGCRESNRPDDQLTGIEIALVVVPAEAIVGKAGLLITLQDETGIPLDGAEVAIRGDMSHAGMIPVLATATGRGNGQYQAEIEWTMAGDWIVTVLANFAGRPNR
jgi:hypothetical protein